MKKLLDFFLVRRPETENKWWHRLFTILLFGSGIVVFIITAYLSYYSYNHKWITYHPVEFSLEPNKPLVYTLDPNYQINNGNDLPCSENPFAFKDGDFLDRGGVKCEGVVFSEFDSKRFSKLYLSALKNLGTQYGFDKYYDTSACPQSADRKCENDIFRNGIKAEEADPSESQYLNDMRNLARIKVAQDINFGLIFIDIATWLIIPIFVFVLWVVFWSSIIYRSVLYIIFGKKK